MLNAAYPLERFLQLYRFLKVKKHLKGSVLDFGGNKGELKRFVHGNYVAVNSLKELEQHNSADTIVSLATIEHLDRLKVYRAMKIFRNIITDQGKIAITTPTPKSHQVLQRLANLGLLDKENLKEHKKYWVKNELEFLAERNGFEMTQYELFQNKYNQLAIFTPK